MASQMQLFEPERPQDERTVPLRKQLLKWIGNKQRVAGEIISYFPNRYGTYFEPFLGSGAVLGTFAPKCGVGADILKPLIDIWATLQAAPDVVKRWYEERWDRFVSGESRAVYAEILASYNRSPNPADILFVSRSCYGGVVRFRKDNGHISTPCGCHHPISPLSFAERVDIWHARVRNTTFVHSDFEPVMDTAGPGDIVYCDPPYVDTQSILYGAQEFTLERLLDAIERCKERGAHVLLSIDGKKGSGRHDCDVDIPEGLFERQAAINCGRSMLRRFQVGGGSVEEEVVHDRLLLTW